MTDADLVRILKESRTVAFLGAHKDSVRPAHYIPSYLFARGYRILPVNPGFAGEVLFGERVLPQLDAIDLFRHGEAIDAEHRRLWGD